MTALTRRLERSAELLALRLEQLETRVASGEDGAWTEYRETVVALCAAFTYIAPGSRGALLTTAEMAERLNITPKSLLRRKSRGQIKPVQQRGKFIRWSGTER
jgi:hypothetical protein